MKHSLGKWIVTNEGATPHNEGIGNVYVYREFPYTWIAEAKGSHVNKTASREEIEANARLIAAAPELLVALNEALFHLQGYIMQYGHGPSMNKKLQAYKELIAKATGEKEAVS